MHNKLDYLGILALLIPAAEQRAPHRITNYIQDLAAHFHRFYNAEKVLTDDTEKTKAHIALIDAVKITLHNALNLVGVTAPESMEMCCQILNIICNTMWRALLCCTLNC